VSEKIKLLFLLEQLFILYYFILLQAVVHLASPIASHYVHHSSFNWAVRYCIFATL